MGPYTSGHTKNDLAITKKTKQQLGPTQNKLRDQYMNSHDDSRIGGKQSLLKPSLSHMILPGSQIPKSLKDTRNRETDNKNHKMQSSRSKTVKDKHILRLKPQQIKEKKKLPDISQIKHKPKQDLNFLLFDSIKKIRQLRVYQYPNRRQQTMPPTKSSQQLKKLLA